MKASELLANVREDYLAEKDQSVEDKNRRWPDSSLLRRLRRAQREACNRGLLIRDTETPRITQIDVVANQADYRLDTRIILVNSIKLQWTDGSFSDLPAITEGSLAQTFGLDWRTKSRLPVAYVPQGHHIRLFPIPNHEHVGFKIVVDCYRFPLATLLAGYSGTLTANADAGATSIQVDNVKDLPSLAPCEEFHLDGQGGTIVCTGISGNSLTCLPLATAWLIGAKLKGDTEPEIPSSYHDDLLWYVVEDALLSEDPDIKGQRAATSLFAGRFAHAFGPPIDHKHRMHTLQSSGSIRFGGLDIPSFRYPAPIRTKIY